MKAVGRLLAAGIVAAVVAACHERSSVPTETPPLDARLDALRGTPYADADLERGELLSLACQACHPLAPGAGHQIGPNLHGVFGRRAGALEDFEYSPVLRASGIVWDAEVLDRWLAGPDKFLLGTTMTFSGYRDPRDRHNLIAYLIWATSPPSE